MLDGMAEERKRHVHRVKDLLRSEKRSQLPMSLKTRQAELAKAVFYLRSSEPPTQDLPTTEGNDADRRGTGLESTVKQIQEHQRDFTDDEEALLNEVLEQSAVKGAMK